MNPSPYRTHIQSQQKSTPLNPFSISSLTSRSYSQSYAKQSKIKPLNELISMRENHHQIISIKDSNTNHNSKDLNNHTVLTKQINLNFQTHQSVHDVTKTSKKNSNSKTKLHLSIKKSNQKYQTPLQTKNSIHNLQTGLKKQKISLLSKIQTLKGDSFDSLKPKPKDSKQNSNENKQNVEQNHKQNHDIRFGSKESPDSGIQKLMLDKLNGKKDIFGPRTMKTTREIIQMKELNKEKQKIKIKLEKKTKNHAFRV